MAKFLATAFVLVGVLHLTLSANVDVSYHIWTSPSGGGSNGDPPPYLATVENQTFFGVIMDEAAASNPSHYGFKFEQYSFGRYVTCIRGKCEEPPKKIHWMLFQTDGAPNSGNLPTGANLTSFGIDAQKVTNGENYLFWLVEVDYFQKSA